jgi:hypothetical protein
LVKRGASAPRFAVEAAADRMPQFCTAAKLQMQTLLTGNGVPASFSVLVRLAYKSGAAATRSAKNQREETCGN